MDLAQSNPHVGLGILQCISHAAVLSALSLAIFSVSRLRLEVDAANGSSDAARVLAPYRNLPSPAARPAAAFLDWWLGPESILLSRERDFRSLVTYHVESAEAGVGRLEGIGALHSLDLDDVSVLAEGQPIDPRTVIALDAMCVAPDVVSCRLAGRANPPWPGARIDGALSR